MSTLARHWTERGLRKSIDEYGTLFAGMIEMKEVFPICLYEDRLSVRPSDKTAAASVTAEHEYDIISKLSPPLVIIVEHGAQQRHSYGVHYDEKRCGTAALVRRCSTQRVLAQYV